ncbi:hypothetical protein ACHAWF_018313, partial [Thalassiosira exigua]
MHLEVRRRQRRSPRLLSERGGGSVPGRSARYFVPLKSGKDLSSIEDEGSEAGPHKPSSSPTVSPASILQLEIGSRGRSSLVRFDPSVAVVTVPSYPPSTRSRLYIPKEELLHVAARNTREFVYEGWDWRNAVEEDGMYTKASGECVEYVHPAHVTRSQA